MRNLTSFLLAILSISLMGCGDIFPDFKTKYYDKVEMRVSSQDQEQSYSSRETLFQRDAGQQKRLNQLEPGKTSTMMSKITGFTLNAEPLVRDQYLDLTPIKKRLAEIPVELTETKGDEIKVGETLETDIKLAFSVPKPGSTAERPNYEVKEVLVGKTTLKVKSFKRAEPEVRSGSSNSERPPFIVFEFEAKLKDSQGKVYPIKGTVEGHFVLNTVI